MRRRRGGWGRRVLLAATLGLLGLYFASGWGEIRLAGSWESTFVFARAGSVMVHRPREGPVQPAFVVPRWKWDFGYEGLGGGAWVVYVPMWVVVLPMAAASAWAWRPQRWARVRRGARWPLAGAGVLCAGMAAGTGWFSCDLFHPALSGAVHAGNGCIALLHTGEIDRARFERARYRKAKWTWLPYYTAFPTSPGEWAVGAPFWMLLVPIGAGCAWAWWRREGWQSACPWCEYDLRGLPAGAVCPECGTARVAKPAG